MRRGFAFLLLAGVFGLTACRPLYGNKPEKLVTPSKRKRPAAKDEPVVVKYVEDCEADFRGDPKRVRPQPAMANQLVDQGNTAMQSAETAKEPKSQAEFITSGIDKYRNALLKDPYNANATLQLALAYDKVLRKGCSLALLKRLATLEANPEFASKAKQSIDRITDNDSWFKGYRKDAINAIGR
jgi:hypothetical protein